MPTIPTIELFSGTESLSRHFREAGDPVFTVELDGVTFSPDLVADVRDLKPGQLVDALGGPPTFLWASPPCTAFSVQSLRHHWKTYGVCSRCGEPTVRVSGGQEHVSGPFSVDHEPRVPKESCWNEPVSDTARLGVELLETTLYLVRMLQPRWWVVENPRAMMRTVPQLRGVDRRTITHCQYGDPSRMKPTDLFGVFPESFQARSCKNGDPCHVAAPRGASTGTQGLASREKAMLPPMLGAELRAAMVREL